MKKFFLFGLILVALLLQSCRATQSTSSTDISFEDGMNSYIGKTKHDLLLQWGSPTTVSSDGDGGEIVTFEQLKRAYTDSFGYVTYVHKYMFYVNRNGIIYHWNYDREGRQGM